MQQAAAQQEGAAARASLREDEAAVASLAAEIGQLMEDRRVGREAVMGLKGNRAELEGRVEALRAEMEAALATKADMPEEVAEAQRQVVLGLLYSTYVPSH